MQNFFLDILGQLFLFCSVLGLIIMVLGGFYNRSFPVQKTYKPTKTYLTFTPWKKRLH